MSTTSGSGRWPVILSGRAIRELRVLAKDKRTFDIVQKKLKELSYGQFTLDNHLVIRGSGEHIPIHRARLSNDLRIVYQVDVMPDSQNQFDRQIIKVFSVSSRARVDYNFWVKVSRYLSQQGAEYRARCIHREVSPNAEGATYIPASFPHQEYNLVVASADYALDEANLNELHETLVLEKFTPVTKSLYNAILADMEAVLPMALNADEKAIVRHQGTTVVIGRSGTGKTTALIYKLRANAQLPTLSGEGNSIRQLFVTRSRVLTQHISTNYRGLVESSEIAFKTPEELAEMRKNNEKYRQRELVEFDNEVDLRDDLPDRFSKLKDSDFPLFVSFDKLCSLLEADLFEEQDVLGSTRLQTRSLITFSDFKRKYWPTFDARLIRNLDPGLVFSEILGVIKGCGENLSREEYLASLSHKKSPLLLNVRDQVYAIFEAYVRQSQLWGEIDTADRTRKILRAYSKSPSSQVDYIFVDEVQDHLMVDVHLLQSLCSNPDGGYWCGDTAQTISVGSSFRIKELKAFIYQNMYANQASSSKYRKAPAPFETFELSVNFRSHGGIVRYAASLVELIYTVFPNAIDHMEPETAKVPGKAPRIFIGSTDDHSEFVHYLLDEKPISEASPFGAQQAIIVRSEATAQSLTTRLEKRCTVLTLLETKGLEFDDIVVYNFFSESEAPTSAWRLVLGLSARSENGRIRYDKSELPSSISPVVCSELKQLYVAVTRARHRCWLWDSGTTIDVMKTFWSSFELIIVSDSLKAMGKFAASSADLRQWAHRGQEFFSNGLYDLAASCFDRAEQDKEAEIARAYHHMSEAKKLQGDKSTVQAAYLSAAKKMEACAKSDDSSPSTSTLWHHTAACFEAAHKIPLASRAYRMGGFYDRATLTSFNAEDIDDCLLTLVPYYERMEASLAEKIMQACRVHYLRASNYGQLQKLFKGDHSACIEYTRSLGFSAQLKDLLKMSRRLEDLANVYLDEGSPAEAVRCLLQNSKSSSLERVQEIILAYLWSNFGLDATPAKGSTEQASQLIGLYSSLVGPADGTIRQDIVLFTALLKRESVTLNELEQIFEELVENDTHSEHCITLGYHHALGQKDWLSEGFSTLVIKHLRAWHTYSLNIHTIANMKSPAQDKSAQRLLGLSPPSSASHSNALHVPNSSALYPSARKGRMRVDKASRRENIVAINDINRLIKQGLTERLKSRLTELHFDIFDSFSNSWNISECHTATPAFYDQLHTLAWVFTVLDPIKTSNVGQIAKHYNGVIGNLWLTQLFNLAFPATGACNNLLLLSRLQEGHELKATVGSWISEALKVLDPYEHEELYITKLIMYLSLVHEVQSSDALNKSVRPPPQNARFPVARGCHNRPDLFTIDLVQFFQRGSPRRIAPLIYALQRIIKHNLVIDGAVLVHFVELITREIILVERAKASWHGNGFSGLVVPSSWARSLTVHPNAYQYASDTGSLVMLLQQIEHILRTLHSGLPGHWKPNNNDHLSHPPSSLITRLHRSLALAAVNLQPARNELHAIFRLLHQVRLTPEDVTNPPDSDSKLNFSEIYNQQSALYALSQSIQHEELVMLSDGDELICPAKKIMVHRIIEFRDLNDLRSQLNGFSVEPEHVPTLDPAPIQARDQVSAEEAPIVFTPATADEVPAMVSTIPQPPDAAPEVVSESASEETKPSAGPQTLSADEAAYRIQSFLGKCLTRQRLRDESEFDEEGLCYEQFRPLFLPLVKRKGDRDRLLLKLLRGPCLSIVLALQALTPELEDFLDNLNNRLHAPDLDPKDIAKLQRDIERDRRLAQGYKDEAELLGRRMSSDLLPKDFKLKNPAAVKTFARNARNLIVKTKNSKVLDGSQALDNAYQLMLYGSNVIV